MSFFEGFSSAKGVKCICLLISLCIVQEVSSQLKLPKKKDIDNATELLRSGTELVYTTSYFINASRRSIEEFNKTVKVIKGNEGQSSGNKKPVPQEDITKPKYQKKKHEFTNFAWEPVAYFEKQLFPSLIISMAAYKGPVDNAFMQSVKSSSLGFRFISNSSFIPLKWEIECVDKKYFDKQAGEVMYEQARQEVCLMPDIPWNYEALGKQQTSAPVNIYFRLFDAEGNKEERQLTVTIRSINDCVTYYNRQNLQFLFTAFVNEDHPEIDKILKQMLETKMITAITGYQQGPEYVDLQVAALWRVLHERGFQYSSITDNSGYNESDGLFAQTVRTFDNSLKTNQANCVDGTVVFASVLKRIGIRPMLVTVPGHCFLGYYMNDTTSTNIRFLETTSVSSTQFPNAPADTIQKYKPYIAKKIPKGVKLNDRNSAFYLEFYSAQLDGEAKYRKNLKDYGTRYVTRINVNDYRKYVKPIPVY